MNSAQVESLLGPLRDLFGLLFDWYWWSIWAKGFGCAMALVILAIVFASVFGLVFGMVAKNRGNDVQ